MQGSGVTNNFGPWLRETRLVTLDPRTRKPYSQARLAKAMKVSASKVAAWESGAIVSISPEDAQRLAEVLSRSEREILEVIGYHLAETSLDDDERELLTDYRQLSPVHKIVERERLRILVRLLRQSGQLPDRGRETED